jgi:hypothetical protein
MKMTELLNLARFLICEKAQQYQAVEALAWVLPGSRHALAQICREKNYCGFCFGGPHQKNSPPGRPADVCGSRGPAGPCAATLHPRLPSGRCRPDRGATPAPGEYKIIPNFRAQANTVRAANLLKLRGFYRQRRWPRPRGLDRERRPALG